ncbi:MAG: TRAP transporter small permease [Mesorhizobium sp.]
MSSAEVVEHSVFPRPIRAALDGLYLVSGWLAGLFLLAIFLLMLGLSGGRVVGIDIPSGDDFTSWCMAASAFLGLAHTFRSGEMIRVGLLIERMKGTRRYVMNVVALAIGVVAMAYFAWYAIDMTIASWRFNDVSQGVVVVPLWIPQIGFSAGVTILAIALLDELIHVLFGGVPRYEKPEPTSAEEIVERAIQGGV